MTRPEPLDESDEMLMALADGELDDMTTARLLTRVEADPALAARLAAFLDTRDALRDAYPPEPVPGHLVDAIMAGSTTPSTVVPFRQRMTARPVVGWAMAACLLLAVGLGGFLAGRGTPDAPASPLLQAAESLQQTPTGGQDAADARVLASYQTELGLCRVIEAGAERGLVCRDQGNWSVALVVPSASGDAYLPASDLGTGLIDAALDEVGAGPALDAAAEAEALAE